MSKKNAYRDYSTDQKSIFWSVINCSISIPRRGNEWTFYNRISNIRADFRIEANVDENALYESIKFAEFIIRNNLTIGDICLLQFTRFLMKLTEIRYLFPFIRHSGDNCIGQALNSLNLL